MARSRTSSDLELLLHLDRASPEPLHRQLGGGLRHAIRDGGLEAGTAVPSSRGLAAQLGVAAAWSWRPTSSCRGGVPREPAGRDDPGRGGSRGADAGRRSSWSR